GGASPRLSKGRPSSSSVLAPFESSRSDRQDFRHGNADTRTRTDLPFVAKKAAGEAGCSSAPCHGQARLRGRGGAPACRRSDGCGDRTQDRDLFFALPSRRGVDRNSQQQTRKTPIVARPEKAPMLDRGLFLIEPKVSQKR